jgi:ArsR family transcriptional regulator
VDLRQGAAEHLPIEAGTVDVALLALVLAYTEDPAAVLKEVRRVLKPGGLVLVIDLQPHEVELFREKLNHRWMGFSREALSGWLAAAGFGGVRWHPLSPRQARAKDGGGGMAVPDLFVLRAEAGVEALRH